MNDQVRQYLASLPSEPPAAPDPVDVAKADEEEEKRRAEQLQTNINRVRETPVNVHVNPDGTRSFKEDRGIKHTVQADPATATESREEQAWKRYLSRPNVGVAHGPATTEN